MVITRTIDATKLVRACTDVSASVVTLIRLTPHRSSAGTKVADALTLSEGACVNLNHGPACSR